MEKLLALSSSLGYPDTKRSSLSAMGKKAARTRRQSTNNWLLECPGNEDTRLRCCVHCVVLVVGGWAVLPTRRKPRRPPSSWAPPSLPLFMICCENVCRGNRKAKTKRQCKGGRKKVAPTGDERLEQLTQILDCRVCVNVCACVCGGRESGRSGVCLLHICMLMTKKNNCRFKQDGQWGSQKWFELEAHYSHWIEEILKTRIPKIQLKTLKFV